MAVGTSPALRAVTDSSSSLMALDRCVRAVRDQRRYESTRPRATAEPPARSCAWAMRPARSTLSRSPPVFSVETRNATSSSFATDAPTRSELSWTKVERPASPSLRWSESAIVMNAATGSADGSSTAEDAEPTRPRRTTSNSVPMPGRRMESFHGLPRRSHERETFSRDVWARGPHPAVLPVGPEKVCGMRRPCTAPQHTGIHYSGPSREFEVPSRNLNYLVYIPEAAELLEQLLVDLHGGAVVARRRELPGHQPEQAQRGGVGVGKEVGLFARIAFQVKEIDAGPHIRNPDFLVQRGRRHVGGVGRFDHDELPVFLNHAPLLPLRRSVPLQELRHARVAGRQQVVSRQSGGGLDAGQRQHGGQEVDLLRGLIVGARRDTRPLDDQRHAHDFAVQRVVIP